MNRPLFITEIRIGHTEPTRFDPPIPFEGEWSAPPADEYRLGAGSSFAIRLRSVDGPIVGWPYLSALEKIETGETYALPLGHVQVRDWKRRDQALGEVRIDSERTLTFGPFEHDTVLCRFRMPFERVPAFEPVVTPKSRLIRRAWARLEPAARLARSILEGLGF